MMWQLPSCPFFCVLFVLELNAANAAVTSRSSTGSRHSRLRSRGSAHASWSPMDLGLGEAGDLSSLRASFNNQEVTVPGEGGQMIEDEMQALQQQPPAMQQSEPASEPRPALLANPQPPVSAPPLRRKPTQQLSALSKAQAQGLMVGAEYDSDVADDDVSAMVTPAPARAPVVAKNSSYIDEYDEVSDDDADDDESRTTPMNETSTREELQRQQKGDVEHLQSPPKRRQYLVKRVRKMVAAQQHAKESKSVVEETDAADQAPPPQNGKSKMMSQCLAFAAWVKGQGSTGPDFVRIWKGTCMPAVMSGAASPQYSNMCNALGAAVGKFALKPWTPPSICQAVVQVFAESGVGASPLA